MRNETKKEGGGDVRGCVTFCGWVRCVRKRKEKTKQNKKPREDDEVGREKNAGATNDREGGMNEIRKKTKQNEKKKRQGTGSKKKARRRSGG
jgi:hypothetical protein